MMKLVAVSTLVLASFVAADLSDERALRMGMKKKSSKSTVEVECSTDLNTCFCPVKRFVYDATTGTQATHITRAASMGCQLATFNDAMEWAQGLAVLTAAGVTVGSNANVWVGAVGSTAGGPAVDNRNGFFWYDTCGDGPLIDSSLWCTPTAEPDNTDFQARLAFSAICGGRLAGTGGGSFPALYECCVPQPEPPSSKSKGGKSMMKKSSRRELRMMKMKKKSSTSKSTPAPAPVCEPLPLSGSAGVNMGAVVPVFPAGMLPPVYECCDDV